jgi:hypothetical protein
VLGDGTQVFECKATVEIKEGKERAVVQLQPIGGASLLKDPQKLLQNLGRFNFDSEESKRDQDFRIFVADWNKVAKFCHKHFLEPGNAVLECDPRREIEEELEETLGGKVSPDQYNLSWLGINTQEEALASARMGQNQAKTKRIFNLFEAKICDPALESRILQAALDTDPQALIEKARAKALSGKGKGKASALIAVPKEALDLALEQMGAGEKPKIRDCGLANTIGALFEKR